MSKRALWVGSRPCFTDRQVTIGKQLRGTARLYAMTAIERLTEAPRIHRGTGHTKMLLRIKIKGIKRAVVLSNHIANIEQRGETQVIIRAARIPPVVAMIGDHQTDSRRMPLLQ